MMNEEPVLPLDLDTDLTVIVPDTTDAVPHICYAVRRLVPLDKTLREFTASFLSGTYDTPAEYWRRGVKNVTARQCCLVSRVFEKTPPRWHYQLLDAFLEHARDAQKAIITWSPWVIGAVPSQQVRIVTADLEVQRIKTCYGQSLDKVSLTALGAGIRLPKCQQLSDEFYRAWHEKRYDRAVSCLQELEQLTDATGDTALMRDILERKWPQANEKTPV